MAGRVRPSKPAPVAAWSEVTGIASLAGGTVWRANDCRASEVTCASRFRRASPDCPLRQRDQSARLDRTVMLHMPDTCIAPRYGLVSWWPVCQMAATDISARMITDRQDRYRPPYGQRQHRPPLSPWPSRRAVEDPRPDPCRWERRGMYSLTGSGRILICRRSACPRRVQDAHAGGAARARRREPVPAAGAVVAQPPRAVVVDGEHDSRSGSPR